MFKKFNRKKIIVNNNYEEKLDSLEINESIIIKKQNPLFRIFKLLIWIIIITGFIVYNNYSSFKTEILVNEAQIIDISKGESIKDLAEKLDLNKVFFKIYLKNNNPDFKLLVGNFQIKADSNIENILLSLKKPLIENEANITILEGWNIYDIDEYLTKKGYIKKEDYINYVTNLDKINKLTEFFPFIEGLKTLEGFLYPDTYKVQTTNFAINKFVIKQLENFENKVYNKLFIEKPLSGILSPSQGKEAAIIDLINLASIVEKEEKNVKEKSTVAGILKKRLNSGWMIGADITVCYPHKLTANECKMVISKYINQKNEYNTRTKLGLPKTPIGNPSFETINATLNSKDTPYWFYLHDTVTGKIYYGKSNTEHEKNKRLYLR